jgi:hypothetical protein
MSYSCKISLKMAGLLETWSNVEEHSVVWFLHVNSVTPMEICSHLVDVYGACVISLKRVWILCSAVLFDNGKIDVDDKLQPGCPSTPIMDNNVCQADALLRQDTSIKLTLLTS